MQRLYVDTDEGNQRLLKRLESSFSLWASASEQPKRIRGYVQCHIYVLSYDPAPVGCFASPQLFFSSALQPLVHQPTVHEYDKLYFVYGQCTFIQSHTAEGYIKYNIIYIIYKLTTVNMIHYVVMDNYIA